MGLLKRTVDSLADLDSCLKAHSQVAGTRGMPVDPRLSLLTDKQRGGNDRPEFRGRMNSPDVRRLRRLCGRERL